MIQSLSNDEFKVVHENFLESMSQLPGAVSLITSNNKDKKVGLTVSAFCSLSMDPPSLIVCINKDSSAHDEILKNGCFAVNVLTSNQSEIATAFATKGVDKFKSGEWFSEKTGSPLLENSLINFDCIIDNTANGFSHTILIGKILHINLSEDDNLKPLLWHKRQYKTC